MKFSEVLTYPNSAEIMMNYGLHCIGCQIAAYETIEQGAKAHGMSNKELNKMIDELNKVANKKEIKNNKIKTEYLPEEPIKSIDIVKEKPKSFFKRLFGG